MHIKNIIFDFGNVLFDLDLGKIPEAFQTLCGDRYPVIMDHIQRKRIFELYEIGGISTSEFVETLLELAEKEISDRLITADHITSAWNSIFVGMPRHRFDFLLRLRQHYQVFLLSNINELHERWIAAYMDREHNIHDFEARYFDGVYYSHFIRLRKPDQDIYEYVLADAELMPGETLFFDDLPINVEAARQVGIHGVLHEVGTDIEERCISMGLIKKVNAQ
jgi:putative hydrolase of the HAD superfamily